MLFSYEWLYAELNIVCCLVIVLMIVRLRRLGQSVRDLQFIKALALTPALFLTDMFWRLIEDGMIQAPLWVCMLMKSGYFLSVPVMCFGWFMYFEYVIGARIVRNKRAVILLYTGVLAEAVLLCLNPYNRLLFYYDAGRQYCRGPLFDLQYLLGYVYVIVSCTHSLVTGLQEDRYAERRLLLMQALFPVPAAIAGLIQYFRPDMPVLCVCLTFAAVIIYMNALEEMISQDPLTGLNNRRKILDTLNARLKSSPQHLVVMMLDVNSFKSINDTYGHPEGDMALVRVADGLRAACASEKEKHARNRTAIARYGGDEFILVAEEDTDEDARRLRDRISSEIARLNKEAGAAYDLTVSCGISRAAPGTPIRRVIADTDAALYEEKHRVHGRTGSAG